MKFKAITIAAAAMLMLPASSHAISGQYGSYPAPAGSLCLNGSCFQLGQGESVEESIAVNFTPSSPTYGFYQTSGGYTADMGSCWYLYKSMQLWNDAGRPSSYRHCVYVGSEFVSRRYSRWLFNDIPAEDRDNITPMQQAIYNETRVGGALVSSQVSVGNILSQTQDTFCRYYSAKDSEGTTIPGAALDRTPQSVMDACSFTIRKSQIVQEQPPTTTQPTQAQPQGFTVPQSAKRCGAVQPKGSRVAVRSSRHSCLTARTVIARYARSLKSPTGWSCTAIVRDTGLRAQCKRKQSARAIARFAVYGIWVRR